MKGFLKFIFILIIIISILFLISCKKEVTSSTLSTETVTSITENTNKMQTTTAPEINWLTFTEWIKGQFGIKNGERIPLWYIGDLGNYSYIASCVVAGEIRSLIGETGNEELAFPVAFQEKVTKKFYIIYVTFGDAEYFKANGFGWNTVFFKDFRFLPPSYRIQYESFETIKDNLHIGDQIVLGFNYRINTPDKGYIDSHPEMNIVINYLNKYLDNNKAISNAMKENKELPQVIITPSCFFINNAFENTQTIEVPESKEITLPQELVLDSTNRAGIKVIIPKQDKYKFSIIKGAYTFWSEGYKKGWSNLIKIYINKPLEFGITDDGAYPINEDATIGFGDLKPTFNEAENYGKDSSTIRWLNKNDYVIFVVPDSYYDDNIGLIKIRIEKF